jgi:hypothetical protein
MTERPNNNDSKNLACRHGGWFLGAEEEFGIVSIQGALSYKEIRSVYDGRIKGFGGAHD